MITFHFLKVSAKTKDPKQENCQNALKKKLAKKSFSNNMVEAVIS